jgi:hypothetical protein
MQDNIKAYSKIISTFGGLAAAGLAIYCTKKLINSKNDQKHNEGYRKIPVPKGAYYYLGILEAFY